MKRWPRGLRTALAVVLGSPCPMWIGWGRDLLFFCNDACLKLLTSGAREIAGLPAREVWGELWTDLGPTIEEVLSTGTAATRERLRFVPTGEGQRDILRTCFSSPLAGPGGGTAGVLSIFTQTVTLPAVEAGAATENRDPDSDRRKAEAALADTENRLRLATRLGKLGIWDWDIDTNRFSWSESLFAIHGVNPEEFAGTTDAFRQLVHPEDRDRVEAATRVALASGSYDIEYRSVRKDGSVAWLYSTGTVMREHGRAVRILGATMDVSERRRALEAVSESEQRFSRFMRHLPGMAWIKDHRGRYVFANGAISQAIGVKPGELLGRTDEEIFPPERAAQFRRNDETAIASEGGTQAIETLIHRDDGRVHHSIVSKFPIPAGAGRPPYVGGMAIDITDRQEAELALQEAHNRLEQRVRERTEELEQANARFQAVFDQGLFAGLLALDGTLVEVNRSWLEATGFTREQVLGRPFWDLGWWTRAADVQAWIKIGFAEAVQGQRFHGETDCFTADGQARRVDFALMPIRDKAGELVFIVPTGLDITERRRDEQERQLEKVAFETDARFRRLADSAPVLIWIADAENVGTWFNQQWLDFVGRPMESELGSGWLDNVHADDAERSARICGEAFARRQQFEIEFRLRRHDGEFRWMLDHGVPTFGHDGNFTGYIGSCVDITERKQAEFAIQRLAAIVESSGDAILAVDLDGFINSWNRGAELLYGYMAAEIIGQSITLLIPAYLQAEEMAVFRRIRAGERIQHIETKRIRKDGSFVEVSIAISPIRDAAGVIVGASKIARDITERKRTESELRRREQLYRAIGDSIDYGVWVSDAAGRNIYASDSFLRLVGITMDECAGLEWTRVLHPDDAAITAAAWAECVRTGTRWEREHRVRGVDGRWHPILARGVPVRDEHGEITSWVGINLDISRLKRNEEALREQTRRLAILNRVGSTLAAELELENVVQVVTDAGREVCGASVGAFFGQDGPTLRGSWQLLAQSGEKTDAFAAFGVPKNGAAVLANVLEDGVVRLADIHGDPRFHVREGAGEDSTTQRLVRSYLAVPVVSRSGAVHGGLFFGHPEPGVFTADAEQLLVAIASQAAIAIDNAQLYRDVQRELREHLRAEHALRESEERFRTLADNIAQFAWTADETGWISWFNRRWFDYTGTTPEAMTGAGWHTVHHPDHLERVSEKYMRSIAEGKVYEDTFPLRRHDGTYRWFLTRVVPIRDSGGKVVRWFGTSTDITELREVEQELERARDEALAASRAKDDFLAALSHELRTPLNPVLLIASDAAEDAALPAEARADFATIRKHVSLEARLIDDLLDLTRISRGKLSLDFAEHEVHAVLRDALATVGGDIEDKPVTLTVEFEADAPRVRADAVRLQQVFWNVLKNAVKFTPAGGHMTLATRSLEEEGTVEITVTDTGIGMSEAELARIFDAFSQGDHAGSADTHRFGGLGLGLAISRMVVELHGGSISASSQGRGQGSTFSIKLPVVGRGHGPASPLSRAELNPRSAPSPGMQVLLVEDHVPTRAALERLLVRRGFVVTPAGSLAEARAALDRGSFRLLISDIGLPDGNGFELMREYRDEGLLGIALTGYGMDEDVARSRDAGFFAHLTKPVSVQSLDRALAEARPRTERSSSPA